MIVMKFGGTSVGDAARMKAVAAIVQKQQRKEPVIVVVSAMSQITNQLVHLARNTVSESHSQLSADLQRIRDLHVATARDLRLDPAAERTLLQSIDKTFVRLGSIVHSLHALGELTPRGQDLVLSFGERLSTQLLSATLKQAGVPAQPVTANELIVANDSYGNAQPLLEQSKKRMEPKLKKIMDQGITPVITGFVAGTKNKVVTTLGRGGSDYSATIIGYCMDAREVWIWTDVDGVMTADPRAVRGARNISQLSYNEAAELSYFGAKVLHPRTMIPVTLSNIPIWIKNTMNPDAPGTKISKAPHKTTSGIKAIAATKGLSLIIVQGKGMSGIPGAAARVFSTIADSGINVLFISVASSENNISFLTKDEDGDAAIQALKEVFEFELATKNVEMVQKEDHLAMVAVVGDGMKSRPGMAGQIFSALGEQSINVNAIAQGSSERNISFVVHETDAAKALQSIHDKLHVANGDKP